MNEVTNIETNYPVSFELPIEHGLTRQAITPSYLLDPALIIAPQASPALVRHYRNAASNLLQANHLDNGQPGGSRSSYCRRIFVTSPHQGDGKTCTSFNLAWTLAQSGKNVLLVELNFVHPRLCAALGNLRVRYGLEAALRGAALPADAVFSLDSTSLYIAAVRNPTTAEKLAPPQANLDAFFDWASDNFDLLVIDCPSVLSHEWNSWFRSSAAPALLVTRENHTPQIEIQRAAKILGSALTSVLINVARRVPAQLAAQPLPRRIASVNEMPPAFLRTENFEIATASERKIR